jgi:tRNA threonylcarbamoyladenosine biosynthesis protein TsaE
MNMFSCFLPDETATLAGGEQLAFALGNFVSSRAVVIFLQGNLGAGKTTLSRGFLTGLGHRGTVKSPTYTLVEPYELPQGAIYHFDLYRLKDPQELEFLGVQDYFDHGRVCLIEWPEQGAGHIPTPDLVIRLVAEQGGRRLNAESHTTIGETVVKTFSAQGSRQRQSK